MTFKKQVTLPVKHMLIFLLTVFLCSFAIAYRYIESSNYCYVRQDESFNFTISSSILSTPAAVATATKSDLFRSKQLSISTAAEPAVNDSKGMLTAASYKGCCLPNTLIIGAKKAGTRALINFLKMHPQVQSAANEVHFFDRDENYSLGLDWYAKKIPAREPLPKVLVEKSPFYFVDENTPRRVHMYNASIKLILLVRDPVKRVLSDQNQFVSNTNGKTSSLEEKILEPKSNKIDATAYVLQPSLYVKYLSRWLQWFKSEQIHIVDGDALVKQNPAYEMKKLESFLQITPFYSIERFQFSESKGFYCPLDQFGNLKCLGGTKGRRNESIIDPKLISNLTKFFRPYNEQFFNLIGHDFYWS